MKRVAFLLWSMTAVVQADTAAPTVNDEALDAAMDRFVKGFGRARADGSSEVSFALCDSEPRAGASVEIWSTKRALGSFRVTKVERLPLCDGSAHRFWVRVPGEVRGPLLVKLPGAPLVDWPRPNDVRHEPALPGAIFEETGRGRVRLEVHAFDVDGDGHPDAIIRAAPDGHPFSLFLIDRRHGTWVQSFADSLS